VLYFVSYASQEFYMKKKKKKEERKMMKSNFFGSLFLSSRVLNGMFASVFVN